MKRSFIAGILIALIAMPIFADWSSSEHNDVTYASWRGQCEAIVEGEKSIGEAYVQLNSSLIGLPEVAVHISFSLTESSYDKYRFFDSDELFSHNGSFSEPTVPIDIEIGDEVRMLNVKDVTEDSLILIGEPANWVVRSLYEGKDVGIRIYVLGNVFETHIESDGSKECIDLIIEEAYNPGEWVVRRGGSAAWVMITKISNENEHAAIMFSILGYPFKDERISVMNIGLYGSEDGNLWMSMPSDSARFEFDRQTVSLLISDRTVFKIDEVAEDILNAAKDSSSAKLIVGFTLEGEEYSIELDPQDLVKYLSYPYRFAY